MQQNYHKATAATSANPFDDSYQPPNLAQEQEQQKVALLEGMEGTHNMDDVLFRERHAETLEITKEMRQIRDISLGESNHKTSRSCNEVHPLLARLSHYFVVYLHYYHSYFDVKDLANIVDDQQMNFDVIEEDAHAIHDSAERGMGHLERAAVLIKSGSQTESFWKVLFGVLATGGLVIAIVCLYEVFK